MRQRELLQLVELIDLAGDAPQRELLELLRMPLAAKERSRKEGAENGNSLVT